MFKIKSLTVKKKPGLKYHYHSNWILSHFHQIDSFIIGDIQYNIDFKMKTYSSSQVFYYFIKKYISFREIINCCYTVDDIDNFNKLKCS